MFGHCSDLSDSLPEKSRVTVYEDPDLETLDGVYKYNPDDNERFSIRVGIFGANNEYFAHCQN